MEVAEAPSAEGRRQTIDNMPFAVTAKYFYGALLTAHQLGKQPQ